MASSPAPLPTAAASALPAPLPMAAAASARRPPFPISAAGASAHPAPPPTTSPAASSGQSPSSPLHHASILKSVFDRMSSMLEGCSRFDSSEFYRLCFSLARGIDYALTINEIPGVAHSLPLLIKKVFQRKNDVSHQAAIMVLMISAKNASKKGWFPTADADELLSMANEFSSSFCMSVSVSHEVGSTVDLLSKVFPRSEFKSSFKPIELEQFYPQLKLCSLILSLEVKPGYEILMADFQIPRNLPPEEKIRLLVVEAQDLLTSSSITSPPHVSFLINGKGVQRRTIVSPDSGPQFPTDITKMLKYGTNILQAIGYFGSTYLIALAFMSEITSVSAPILKDYVQPAVAAVDADSEIIVGSSRVTLNCPISFRRIKTPVKGQLCKHRQCFDYDNYMEMNSRKPSWRCPFCNQSVISDDLRIDQNMLKILREVGEDIAHVIISADGSWKPVVKHDTGTDQPGNGIITGQQDGNMEYESNESTSMLADVVDLTMEEDGQGPTAMSSGQVDHQNYFINQHDNHAVEAEDIKPFKDTPDFPISQFLTDPPLTNYASMTNQPPTVRIGNSTWSRMVSSTSAPNGPLTLVQPDAHVFGTSQPLGLNIPANPVITDAFSPVVNEESHHLSLVSQSAENTQLQYPRLGNSSINSETERSAIPRHVNRSPIAIQALPVPTQPPSLSKRMRTIAPNFSSFISNGPSSSAYQERDPQTQIGSLAPSNPISTRMPSSQPGGSATFRASLRSPPEPRNSYNLLPNVWSHLQNQISSGSLRSSNLGLPTGGGGTNDLASQYVAQQITRLQASAANQQASRTTPSNPASISSPRLSGSEQLPNMAGPQQPEQNWRPTGRMRGSLTGSAYSAALSHYLVPSAQTAQARSPNPSVVASTSNQQPGLNAAGVNAFRPVTQQANSMHGNFDKQSEGPSTNPQD